MTKFIVDFRRCHSVRCFAILRSTITPMRALQVCANIVGVVVCSLLILSLSTSPAIAHVSGASWNATSTPYIIDVGYTPDRFVAGEYAVFDFLLWRDAANVGKPVDFTEAWVRVLRDKETLLATGIRRQQLGPTTLLYTFANPGEYSLSVSFRNQKSDELAAAEFRFKVLSKDSSWKLGSYLLVLIALGIGVSIGVGFSKLRNAFKS